MMFCCNVCGKFGGSSHLQRHMKHHLPSTPTPPFHSKAAWRGKFIQDLIRELDYGVMVGNEVVEGWISEKNGVRMLWEWKEKEKCWLRGSTVYETE